MHDHLWQTTVTDFFGRSKFFKRIAWFVLTFPVFAAIVTSGDVLFFPSILLLLIFYLRKPRAKTLAISILYGFFVYFHPLIHFIKPLDSMFFGETSIAEGLSHIIDLMLLRSTVYFNYPSAILALLTIPSVYLINLNRTIRSKPQP